jgi:branched-subunit amino acid aminotransferase/4-amino-4-deoxychorismate lyase
VTAPDLKPLALYNYGHFTSMRSEGGAVRGLSLHLARLEHDSQRLFGTSLESGVVRTAIREAIESGPDPVVVRVTVFAADIDLGNPGRSLRPEFVVTTRSAPALPQRPITLRTSRYQRDLATVKHVGLFGQLWHRRLAQLDGYDDVLFVDSSANVSEGATWNIGFIEPDGDVVWPQAAVLPGITLRLLQQAITQAAAPEPRASKVAASELGRFAGAFITNAVSGVRGVRSIDQHSFPSELPRLTELADLYNSLEPEPV